MAEKAKKSQELSIQQKNKIIKKRYKGKINQIQLAKEYGVSEFVVGWIKKTSKTI